MRALSARANKKDAKRPSLGRVLKLEVADTSSNLPPQVTLSFFVCHATQKQAVSFAQDLLEYARGKGIFGGHIEDGHLVEDETSNTWSSHHER